uniref:Ribonuclease VapC n=1 Tax=uncultured Thiotrichaceae bacterium TaxID=298394 RepID=A0A6S6U6C4_9GAMM|nr:MAG: Ribonuclease VapC [uncultured Thiotrichaceae bacterium]
MNLVVDASVAIKWFVPEIHWEYAARLQGCSDLYAPDFMLLECSNILIKKVRRQEISHNDADEIQQALSCAPLDFYPWQELLESATLVAHETYRSVYDCIYLVLAQQLGGQMVTADKKFYQSLEDHPIWSAHLLWIEDVYHATEEAKKGYD